MCARARMRLRFANTVILIGASESVYFTRARKSNRCRWEWWRSACVWWWWAQQNASLWRNGARALREDLRTYNKTAHASCGCVQEMWLVNYTIYEPSIFRAIVAVCVNFVINTILYTQFKDVFYFIMTCLTWVTIFYRIGIGNNLIRESRWYAKSFTS